MTSPAPSVRVLTAFGATAQPVVYPMGRGATWAAGEIVLKPVDDEAEATWVATLAASTPERGFRLARPIAASDGRWTVDGWSAWTRLPGEHSTTRWRELLDAAAAFHAAVGHVEKPEFIDRRADRWRIADRVAWGELSADALAAATHVGPLLSARRPVSLPGQLVHGDLVGNVLFADGLAPALIDLSLYWRPAAYSAAIVVGDALTWEGASNETIRLIDHVPEWPQLLLRAVLFRIVVNELARRAEPARADLSGEYDRVVALALSLVERSP